MLSEKTKQSILELQKIYPEKRSALIPALHMAQVEVGYLPLEAQKDVAELFSLDVNEVQSVVTFYDMFFEEPVGKHVIHLCKNISCMLRGADELSDGLCKRLQIKPGETTSDGEFTVIHAECLGACDRAPMMIVDDRAVGPVDVNDIENFIVEAKKGPGHAAPVEMVRENHG